MSYYTGAKARGYEAHRRRQPKWRFEQSMMQGILSALRGKIDSVIDAPVGTGRFLGLYRVPVWGYDISQDMLDQAAAKSASEPVDLAIHDLREPLPRRADLVVCVRFLNLIDRATAERLLDNLLGAARKYAVFTLRTVPDDRPAKRIGRVYIHQESLLTGAVERNGFQIMKRYHFKDSVTGQYDLILCRRTA